MKLILKIIGWTFVSLIVLLVLIAITLTLISDEQYKKWATAAASSATGRELRIDGEFNVNIGSQLGILANNIHFANAKWGTRVDMVSADRLEVRLSLLPLFKGVLDLFIKIDGPNVLLETNDQKKGNWVVKEPDLTSEQELVSEAKKIDESSVFPLKPYLSNFEINRLAFVFKDASGGQEIQAEIEKLRAYVDGAEISLSLAGTYQGGPIALDGKLGIIEDYHLNQATPIALQGLLNGAIVGINGSLGPLFPEAQAQVDLALESESVAAFSPFAGFTLPDLKGLEIATTLSTDGGRFSGEKVRVLLNDSKLNLEVIGSIADLAQVAGIDLQVEINSDQISELSEQLKLTHGYSLPRSLNVKTGLQGDLKTLSVTDLDLMIQDDGLDARLIGNMENVLAPAGADAKLSIALDSIETIGRYLGRQLPGFGPLNVSAEMISPEQKIQLKSLRAELTDPALSATISGSIEHIARSADDAIEVSGIKLKGQVNSEQLDAVAAQFNFEMPVAPPAAIAIAASATGSLDQLNVSDLKAVITDEGLEVSLTGTVGNLLESSGVDVQIQARAENTSNLSKFVDTDLPELGSLELQSRIVSAGKTYRLEALDLKLIGDALKANLSAVIEDMLILAKVADDRQSFGAAGIDVSLTAEARSASEVAQFAGIELPEIGSLQLDGQVVSSERSLRLESMNAKLINDGMEAQASAAIADLFKLSGVKTTIDAEMNSLSHLSPITNSELPETGPWSLQARAEGDVLDGPTTLTANLAGEGIKAVVDLFVPDVLSLDTFQAKLAMEAESLPRLGVLMNKELPDGGPLKVVGNTQAKPGEYRVDEFQITMGESEIGADLAYTSAAQADSDRSKIAGQVNIKNLDITPLLASSQEEAELISDEPETADKSVEETTGKRPVSNKKLFSSEPFSTGALQKYNIDLKVNAANVTISKGFSIDGSTSLTLDDGLLKLGPVDIQGKTGGFGEGLIVVDARNPVGKLDVFLDLEDFVPPRLGGTLDIDADLDGSGESLAAIMGSLNGRFIVALNDVELNKSAMTKFGAGVFSRINPFGSDTTMLECAIARFDAKDGMVDVTRKLAAQTTEVTWFGSGDINLKTEELDLGIHPKPRNAIGSVTDIGLAKLIHIGGTLADPSVGFDPVDAAKKYASYSAFIATGGLSFLAEKVFDNLQANRDQCKQILADLAEE